MREVPYLLRSIVAGGSVLGMLDVVADIPVTVVGYSIVSPRTMRPRKYRKVCTAVGMEPTDRGWGYLRCFDAEGQRLTLMTEDVDYMELLIAARKAGTLAELEVSVDTFPITRPGWPDDCQLDLAGVRSAAPNTVRTVTTQVRQGGGPTI
jgi:hypothetical protein